MKNQDSIQCPICKDEVLSDATIKNYCALCGMAIEEEGKEYCSKHCEIEFKKLQ